MVWSLNPSNTEVQSLRANLTDLGVSLCILNSVLENALEIQINAPASVCKVIQSISFAINLHKLWFENVL